MTVIAYRYRAYPNAGQRELFARHFGCKRKVFNFYLEEAHRLFQKTGSILSAYVFIKKLPAIKRTPELKYLAEVNSQSLQSEDKDQTSGPPLKTSVPMRKKPPPLSSFLLIPNRKPSF